MKSIRSPLLIVILIAAGIFAVSAAAGMERVSMHAIDVAAEQMRQPYSVPDALERQLPAGEKGNSRALAFALVMLLALAFSVVGLLALYFGAPFLKQARGLARDARRRPSAPSRLPLPRALPALPQPDPAPALPAPTTPGEVEWF